MNRDSIINKVFSRAFLGYDAEEVDSFLDEVIRELDRMRQELDVSRLRNKMLIEELDRYRTAAQEKAADDPTDAEKYADEPSDAEETAEKAAEEAAEEPDEEEVTPVEEQAEESAEEQSAPTDEPIGESEEEEAAPEGNEESNTTPIEETEQTEQTDATEAADVQ